MQSLSEWGWGEWPYYLANKLNSILENRKKTRETEVSDLLHNWVRVYLETPTRYMYMYTSTWFLVRVAMHGGESLVRVVIKPGSPYCKGYTWSSSWNRERV